VDARVKAGLLEPLDHAVGRGWDEQAAASLLGIGVRRARRWRARPRHGTLADTAPGGVPGHAIMLGERAAILALYEVWKDIDRSHRKLAHRGSREGVVWVSESTLLRVLREEHLIMPGNPPREPGSRGEFPDWVAWKPNSIWIYAFTHFTACGRAAIAVMDVVSRYWLTTLVSAQETSLQVEVAFINALTAAGLEHLIDLDTLHALRAGQITVTDLDDRSPVLLALSDNGPQMRSTDTRGDDGRVRDRPAVRPALDPDRPGLDRVGSSGM
jgi:hypothetical protein